MATEESSPRQGERWEFGTPKRGRLSDTFGQAMIAFFIFCPVIGSLVAVAVWEAKWGSAWTACVPLGLAIAILCFSVWFLWRYVKRAIHSIRFDGEKLWLGRSNSFPPSEVCMLEAFQRPRRALSHVAIWRENARRYSRVYFGPEDLPTVCEKLDELCPQAVKIWMPGEIVLPDGFDRESPGFSRLRWFFVSRICWNLASGLIFLAWGTAVATDVDNAFEVVMVALPDFVGCMGLWHAWRDFRVWKSVRAEIPETTDRRMR